MMFPDKIAALRIAALALVFCWFFIGGVCHFLFTDDFVSVVPPGLPLRLEAVYISGVFELLGAIGILWPPTRQAAGYGLIALTICVTPANVYMWQHPELFPNIPQFLLLLRLPVQALLIWCIWWATANAKEK